MSSASGKRAIGYNRQVLGRSDRIPGSVIRPPWVRQALIVASEALHTLVMEREALGAQAGTTSRSCNYCGFPRTVSGRELTTRAYDQAWLLGANFLFVNGTTGLRGAIGARAQPRRRQLNASR